MPGLRVEPPSNFRILCNVASGNGYGSRQGAGYVEWYEDKSSWKDFGTHLPPEWASTHSSFIEDEGGRSKKRKRVAEESPVVLIGPSKEGKKKAKVHVAPATSFPITSIDVLATSKLVSLSTVGTRGSARRTRRKDEKGSRDLPIDFSVGDKSPSGNKETSAKAVKAFAGDVDAAVDVGNTLTKEGVHVNATARKFSTLNESNINICEPERLADPDRGGILTITWRGDDDVETVGAQIELAPMAEVETHNDSIRDDVIIVPPHASPATHDSLGIELPPMIESTKVVEPATIAGRLAEEFSRPFNSDDYFAGLGAFLDTMRPSYVGLPMIRDKLIAHAAPTSEGIVDPNKLALILHGGNPATVSEDGTSSNDSEGLRSGLLDQDARDPYDDMDDNLVVREVLAPFSGEIIDTSSSSSEGIEVSPARDDDLNLTLRVPYSRLHGFKFGCGSSSFYLCLLSSVLCDMRRTPLELVTERKL
ncbi:hypothetical protein FCV25MIE_24513 [Fagus crenata]